MKDDEEIFLPLQKLYDIKGRKFQQTVLPAYNLIKLANLFSKKLTSSIIKNPTVARMVTELDIMNPDPAKMGSLIFALISEIDNILEFIMFLLTKENGEDLDEEDLEHIRKYLMPVKLTEIIQDLIELNKDELKKVIAPFRQMFQQKGRKIRTKEK